MSNGYKTAHLVDEFGSYAVLYLPGFIQKKTMGWQSGGSSTNSTHQWRAINKIKA